MFWNLTQNLVHDFYITELKPKPNDIGMTSNSIFIILILNK
jgi:hypothetical protein